jgi:peptidoglycan/xylan/chitin deacetylase (PgdA/CDA1 family)
MLESLPHYSMKMSRRLATASVRSALGTITHVRTRDPVVALTFDDGPDPDYTPRLLDILEKYDARATFFMTGEAAQQHPDIVRRVARGGHGIGNHSWDHPSFPLISGPERRAQIRNCAKALKPYAERLFRPPYGDQNIVSRLDAFLLGYKVIMFNVATNDWCGEDAISIAAQVERKIRPGSVIVLHDRLSDALEESYFNRDAVVEAVAILLQHVSARFRFVTIRELLRRGKAQREVWYQKADLELLNKLRRPRLPGRQYALTADPKWLAVLRNTLLQPQER